MADNLFFVHVPRCGGTSLMKSHDVPKKCRKGRSLWGKLGMIVFFQRYAMLESANFPIFTGGNALATVLFAIAFVLWYVMDAPQLHVLSICLMAGATGFVLGLSFIFTAPTIGRLTYIRRIYLILVHYVLCRFMESIDWCTGTNKKGYINHLTAHKLLNYGYVTPEVLEAVPSLAIVRNPYARMVSIYMYNRFGALESFEHFVKSWYNLMKRYRESGEMEEWYTPCHGIPQFEYTHYAGKQLVQSIVKQEELDFLTTKEELPMAVAQDSSVSDLPDVVRNALLGMPHSNQRTTKKKWYDFYTQETLELVYDLYQSDFDIFNYSTEMPNRPDLKSPSQTHTLSDQVEAMLRDSMKSEELRSLRHTSLLESSRMPSRLSSMRGKMALTTQEESLQLQASQCCLFSMEM